MLKKTSFLAIAAGIVLFSSCTEKGPVIAVPKNRSVDTTYTVTPPAAQPRKVLIEEFTGASCSNCPQARAALANLSNQHPDRLVILGIHIYGFWQSNPVKESTYDFRTQDGTDLGQAVYNGVSFLPIAGVDRIPNAKNELLLGKDDWGKAIDDRLKKTPDVNLEVSSKYNAGTGTAEIKLKATYLKAMTDQQYISLCVVEDDLVDKQDSSSVVIEKYNFKHVLRDFITPTTGVPVSLEMMSKEPGRVFERVYSYKVDDKWKPEKCHVVAFIHNNNGTVKEVLQTADAHLAE